MAKLVGTEHGHFVQAAAGWQEEVLTPQGVLAALAAAIGGWTIGAAVGATVKEGEPLLEPLPFEGDDSDGQAFLSMVGLTLGTVVSVHATKEAAEQYGWQNLLLYSGGLATFVVVVKVVRGEYG